MKENTRYIVMVVLLLFGIIKINEQRVDLKTMAEQKGSVENDEETKQMDQFLIKPLEQYPFDCEVMHHSNESNCC